VRTVTDRDVAQLWRRMARIYGHRWVSSFGDADDGTWLAGLADLLPCEIAAGIRRCIASADPWPPTLPAFRALCLGLADETDAVEAAAAEDRTDPVARELLALVPSFDRHRMSAEDLRARYRALWSRAYRAALEARLELPPERREALAGGVERPRLAAGG